MEMGPLHGGAKSPAPRGLVDGLLPLFSALSASSATAPTCDVSAADVAEVVAAVQHVAEELLGSHTSSDVPLMEAGLDSLGAVEFRSRLSSQLADAKLPETLVFDYPTLRQVKAHVHDVVNASRTKTAPGASGEALIGGAALQQLFSQFGTAPSAAPATHGATDAPGAAFQAGNCQLGGSVHRLTSAWSASAAAHDAVASVPEGRWHLPVQERVAYGAYLHGVQLFDLKGFDISPLEADVMDPHQRVALEGGYSALNAAGRDRGTLMGSMTSVFAGIWSSDYTTVLSQRVAASSGPFAMNSTFCSMLVGRISYTLGLQGPSIPYDTACSSSLSAFHGALCALQRQETDLALLAGVNVMCHSDISQLFAASGMTSPTGKSYTFDSRADGYARAEACCCAVLQVDWSEAMQCLAGAVRQDGRSASLTAPNGVAQQVLLRAALQWAGQTTAGAFLLEAHGTGTSLGDPIETRAMVAVREEPQLLATMGCKANFGHTEPAAGLTGMLKLSLAMQHAAEAPNAQLRAINPHVKSAMHEGQLSSLPVHLGRASTQKGGVSSFGLNGTIAHAVLAWKEVRAVDSWGASRKVTATRSQMDAGSVTHQVPPSSSLAYRRRAFPWLSPSHPFLQHCVAESEVAITFQSSTARFAMLVANHIVHGQVLMPAAGYLEMARASASGSALRGVFFLQPLAIQTTEVLVECSVADGRFEVRSGEADALADVGVHCSGTVATGGGWRRVKHASVRTSSCAYAASVGTLYDGFYATQDLQYGPGYRTLAQAWGGESDAVTRLRARATREATEVHPADLDDALCTSYLIMSSGGGETRLPFAVDDAQLQGALGKLWAVRHPAAAQRECALRRV